MNILSKDKDFIIKIDNKRNSKRDIRCLCDKLLAEINNGSIEILCKRCKRVVRLKLENVIHLENCCSEVHD